MLIFFLKYKNFFVSVFVLLSDKFFYLFCIEVMIKYYSCIFDRLNVVLFEINVQVKENCRVLLICSENGGVMWEMQLRRNGMLQLFLYLIIWLGVEFLFFVQFWFFFFLLIINDLINIQNNKFIKYFNLCCRFLQMVVIKF